MQADWRIDERSRSIVESKLVLSQNLVRLAKPDFRAGVRWLHSSDNPRIPAAYEVSALVHDSAAAGMEGCCFLSEWSSMPHKFNAKRRHKFAKARYLNRNWPDYDRALCRRGDLRLWISEAAIEKWRVCGGRGIYSDLAISSGCTQQFRRTVKIDPKATKPGRISTPSGPEMTTQCGCMVSPIFERREPPPRSVRPLRIDFAFDLSFRPTAAFLPDTDM